MVWGLLVFKVCFGYVLFNSVTHPLLVHYVFVVLAVAELFPTVFRYVVHICVATRLGGNLIVLLKYFLSEIELLECHGLGF